MPRSNVGKAAAKTTKQAKNSPAIRTGVINAMDEEVGSPKPRNMRSTGPAALALDPEEIVIVDRPVDQEKLANLAFMREKVKVMIHEANAEIDEKIFEISINGKSELFHRGETKVVMRMYVNELATRKVTRYTQERYIDENGVKNYKNVPSSALRYPFSVLEDANPLGPSWLRATLLQA